MHHSLPALRLGDGDASEIKCCVADEVPIGLQYNGFPHAVLMATPADLDDLAVGFSLTDGICLPGEIERIVSAPNGAGIDLQLTLNPVALARFLRTRQSRMARSYTSCGICGIESIDALPQPRPTGHGAIDQPAIRRALASLPDFQVLSRLTGATHAAAWVADDGGIIMVREDVGRHNALDKLIGVRARCGEQGGFCLMTSRCSYEIVQKASVAGFGLLVCISAPTALAIETARQAGVTLVALARMDSQTVYAGFGR